MSSHFPHGSPSSVRTPSHPLSPCHTICHHIQNLYPKTYDWHHQHIFGCSSSRKTTSKYTICFLLSYLDMLSHGSPSLLHHLWETPLLHQDCNPHCHCRFHHSNLQFPTSRHQHKVVMTSGGGKASIFPLTLTLKTYLKWKETKQMWVK